MQVAYSCQPPPPFSNSLVHGDQTDISTSYVKIHCHVYHLLLRNWVAVVLGLRLPIRFNKVFDLDAGGMTQGSGLSRLEGRSRTNTLGICPFFWSECDIG
jgi:hypothetical protein